MLENLVGTLVMLIPVFLLLVMTFGAGFAIGRISRPKDG
jgi:hypothetical protein